MKCACTPAYNKFPTKGWVGCKILNFHFDYLTLTHSLTHCCLVNFIDVTLACEDANSKLVDVVTVADDDRVGNNLLQIWKPRFGQKSKCLFRL